MHAVTYFFFGVCCAVAGSPGRCENGEGPEVRSQREVGPEAAKAGSQRCAMDRAGGGGR